MVSKNDRLYGSVFEIRDRDDEVSDKLVIDFDQDVVNDHFAAVTDRCTRSSNQNDAYSNPYNQNLSSSSLFERSCVESAADGHFDDGSHIKFLPTNIVQPENGSRAQLYDTDSDHVSACCRRQLSSIRHARGQEANGVGRSTRDQENTLFEPMADTVSSSFNNRNALGQLKDFTVDKDYHFLQKIQENFDSFLETVPSVSKREYIINKFIMFLINRRNTYLENFILKEEAAFCEDRKQHVIKDQGFPVYSQVKLLSSNWPLGHCSDSVSASIETAETTSALNLTVPRKTVTPVLDDDTNRRLVGDDATKSVYKSTTVPRPAHRNELRSHVSGDIMALRSAQTVVASRPEQHETLSESGSWFSPGKNISIDSSTTLRPPSDVPLIVLSKARLEPFSDRVTSNHENNVSTSSVDRKRFLSADTTIPVIFKDSQISESLLVTVPSFPGQVGSVMTLRIPVKSESHEESDCCSSLLSVNDANSVPSPPKRHKNKKITAGESPKKEHIKRPMNSFMCWAHGERARLSKLYPSKNNADISRMLGEKWRKMTPDEKKPYEEQSVKHSALLMERHPDYRYRPRRKEKSYSSESRVDKKQEATTSSPEADQSQLYAAAQADNCFGAVAGLMSLNKGWINMSNTSSQVSSTGDASLESLVDSKTNSSPLSSAAALMT